MHQFFCIAFQFLISGTGSKEEMSISSVQKTELLLKCILNISSLDSPDNASVFFCPGRGPRLKVDLNVLCQNKLCMQKFFFRVIFKAFLPLFWCGSYLKCWHQEKVSQLSQTGDPAHFRYYYVLLLEKKEFCQNKNKKRIQDWDKNGRLKFWTRKCTESGFRKCFKSYG